MPDTSGVSPAAKQCYVVASNSFIAEDAAQVLRESLPECDVQLFDHPDSAASALQLTDEHVHVWMIGPRWDLARHTLGGDDSSTVVTNRSEKAGWKLTEHIEYILEVETSA